MNVANRALQSTIFVSISTYLTLGISFITSVVMARLLEPQHFGVVALGSFFLSLFGRIREFGFDYALVHRQDDLKKAYSAHFILQLCVALLTFVIILISSPFLARFYSTEVVFVLLILSSTVILKAASSTQRIALEKELLFKATAVIDIISLIISSSLGIAAAFLGWGLWSLVVSLVTNALFIFLGLWLVRPWKPELIFDKSMIKWFFKFGFFLFIGGITTFVLFQYNDFIIGTYLGAAVLGFYSRAFNFASLPTSLVTSVVSKVALPTYSKLQNDKEKLSQAFSLVLKNIIRISVPLSLLLFLTAHDFILFLIGEKWLPMVPIFQLLIIFSLFRPIFDDTGAFLTAIGKPYLITKYLITQALLLLVLSPILVSLYGVNGAAYALNIVMIVGVLIAYWYTSKEIKISFTKIFGSEIVVAGLTLVIYQIFVNFIELKNLDVLMRLITKGLVLGGTYLILLLLIEGKKIKEEFLFLKSFLVK